MSESNKEGLRINELRFESVSYPKVVKVIADDQVIISAGKKDGVKYGDEYGIYEVGEELFHPDTKESLGNYEVHKGRGKIAHVMEKMSVLDYKVTNSLASVILNERVSGFKNAKIGDEARKMP